jgi:hypothetical protein
MKLESVRLYQAIPIGQKLETFLTTKGDRSHPGLTLEWSKGLLKIECKALEKPSYVPSANVMYMVPADKASKPE